MGQWGLAQWKMAIPRHICNGCEKTSPSVTCVKKKNQRIDIHLDQLPSLSFFIFSTEDRNESTTMHSSTQLPK